MATYHFYQRNNRVMKSRRGIRTDELKKNYEKFYEIPWYFHDTSMFSYYNKKNLVLFLARQHIFRIFGFQEINSGIVFFSLSLHSRRIVRISSFLCFSYLRFRIGSHLTLPNAQPRSI